MTVYIKIKSLAKRKPLIDNTPFETTGAVAISDDLVEQIVRKMVRDYNAKPDKNHQDEEAAVKNALTCFSDGIFRLFINDGEIGANSPISLKENDSITFIRLTMLTGLLW